MKTAELTGIALDWAVLKCECDIPAQFVSIPALLNGSVRVFRGDIGAYSEPVRPSTNWAHGGPIIEREGIEFWTADSYQDEYGKFTSIKSAKHPASMQHYKGPTPLIAAMRCYVASKLGDEVEIPEGLK
jgi:hypothetical protein